MSHLVQWELGFMSLRLCLLFLMTRLDHQEQLLPSNQTQNKTLVVQSNFGKVQQVALNNLSCLWGIFHETSLRRLGIDPLADYRAPGHLVLGRHNTCLWVSSNCSRLPRWHLSCGCFHLVFGNAILLAN
jgi:hypothetical protein